MIVYTDQFSRSFAQNQARYMAAITVFKVNDFVISMTWPKYVTPEQVTQAFTEVGQHLSAAQHPMFIVVDIRNNPKFPVPTTLTGALSSAYRSKNLREWLIIGSSTTARFLDRTLATLTGLSLVRWFTDESAVAAYVAQRTDTGASKT